MEKPEIVKVEGGYYSDWLPYPVEVSFPTDAAGFEWRLLREDGEVRARGVIRGEAETFEIPAREMPPVYTAELSLDVDGSQFIWGHDLSKELPPEEDEDGDPKIDDIEWRIQDASGKTLFQGKTGEGKHSFTIPDQAVPAPPMPHARLVSPWGDPKVEVFWPGLNGHRAVMTLKRYYLDDEEEVAEAEFKREDEDMPHTEVLVPDGPGVYDVEATVYDEDDEAVDSFAWRGFGVEAFLGTAEQPVATTSHRTAEKFVYDRKARYPAYLAGQVLLEGEPTEHDVLVLDNREFTLLYRPRVGSDGKWEVRNIPRPPRRDWRGFMVIARDSRRRYNSQVIDHVKPKMVEEA